MTTTSVKTVSILGSTGSIGRQTVALLARNRDRFRIRALTGGRNSALLAEQARLLGAEVAVIGDPACYGPLAEALADTPIEVAAGREAVVSAAARDADWTMAAITGMAGLPATLAAIRRGGTIALANKEALVSAGEVMLQALAQAHATLLPVDSEHNAVFQALAAGNRGAVEKIVLTASGGPFRSASLAEMARATPEAALHHPVWSMGAKISIDSATLMNKGLEVIEAARLFSLPGDQIGVLIHPQAVVHGLAYYADGSVLAQLGVPNMQIPIAHALAWPERLMTEVPRLDLAALARLEFTEPDRTRFPALALARQAIGAGGGAPAILNAANEIAVAAFLERRIGFLDIVRITESVLGAMGAPAAPSLESVLALDAEARRRATALAALALPHLDGAALDGASWH
ncbi:MAG: 1-deoxy-D-xylulose-5-phosphate reductoisomerase [Acetobacteraceae bacterium]